MITVKFNSRTFQKEMKNIVDYSVGFIDGVQLGKQEFFNRLGPLITEKASQFIDANARQDYKSLHHVYEWSQTGDASGRLFEIKFTVSNLGLSFFSNFSQSKSIQQGSRVPFYNKASIMESGKSVVIEPRFSEVLRFEVGGEVVYTRKPVVVDNPGGNTEGQYQSVFDMFFRQYFSQAFLRSSGLAQYFENPQVYKKNLSSAKRGGRALGITTGSRWIANAGKVA
jgi:hypothetical protein